MRNKTLQAVKQAIRQPYAFPGGYPLYIVCVDGEALCIKCTLDNYKSVAQDTIWDNRDSWHVAGVDINWENPSLPCAHCEENIETAYDVD